MVQYIKDEHVREFQAWSGGKDTLNHIIEIGKEDELENYLNEVFEGREQPPTDTEINDVLWFNSSDIYEYMGLDENGDEPIELNEEWENLKQSIQDEEALNTVISFALAFNEPIKDEYFTWLISEQHKHSKVQITDTTGHPDIPKRQVAITIKNTYVIGFDVQLFKEDDYTSVWKCDNLMALTVDETQEEVTEDDLVDTCYYIADIVDGWTDEQPETEQQ